jgi:hypothetical protein
VLSALTAWPADRLGRPPIHFLLRRASNGCCDPEALAESFLSHLQARNKDSKPGPKTNQYCAEFTGSIDRKMRARRVGLPTIDLQRCQC